MDAALLTDNFVPIIIVACGIVGYLIKNTPVFAKISNDYIPLIVCTLGAILGVVVNGMGVEPIVYGAISGLASTGLHQSLTTLLQFGGSETNISEKKTSETKNQEKNSRE